MAEISFFRLFYVNANSYVPLSIVCAHCVWMVVSHSPSRGNFALSFHFIFFDSPCVVFIVISDFISATSNSIAYVPLHAIDIHYTAYDRKPVTRHFAFKAIKKSNNFTFPSIAAYPNHSQHCSFPVNAIYFVVICNYFHFAVTSILRRA